MRIFANLFLMLFLADGAVSVLDELVSLVSPLPGLSGLRSFLADLAIFTAISLYFCLGIDKRLPKRVFIPMILFVCWFPVSSWFFPHLSDNRTYGLLAATAQILLCLLPVRHFGNTNRLSLMLPRKIFDAPFFDLRNTVIFGAANLFVVPFALLLTVLCSADSYIRKHSAGFMRLAPDGLRMTEKVYRRDNRTIRLAAMIHVGEKEYYEKVLGEAAPGRTLVLAEGVTDDKHLLRDKPDYGKFAGYLGLTEQQEQMHLSGRPIEAAELDEPPPRADGKSPERTDILRGDVDVSSFRPATIRFLNELGRQMKENPSFAKDVMLSDSWSKTYFTPEMQKVIMEDILNRRNKEVIGHLRKAVSRYDTVIVPWGALHMVEIEEEVLSQGFKLQQERERVSIDFRRVLMRKAALK